MRDFHQPPHQLHDPLQRLLGVAGDLLERDPRGVDELVEQVAAGVAVRRDAEEHAGRAGLVDHGAGLGDQFVQVWRRALPLQKGQVFARSRAGGSRPAESPAPAGGRRCSSWDRSASSW